MHGHNVKDKKMFMVIYTRKTFIENGEIKSVDVQQFVHSLAVLNEVWITFTLKTPKVTPKAPPNPTSHIKLSPEMSNLVT